MVYSSSYTVISRAANKGYEAIAKSLLEKNAQLDVKDENGLTPLHWAAREVREEMMVTMMAGSLWCCKDARKEHRSSGTSG